MTPMPLFLFKAEVKNTSERGFIRLFERKWKEEDIFSVNLMLTIAEEVLGTAAHLRFKEQYERLSAEGFSREEKNAVVIYTEL